MSIQLAGAAIVAFDHARPNMVLLGKRNKEEGKGLWVLPGGKIETGESPEQAVIREGYEEVGLKIVAPQKVCFEWLPDCTATGCLMLYFMTEVSHDEPRIVAANEFSDLQWFDAFSLPPQMWQSDRMAISMALAVRQL